MMMLAPDVNETAAQAPSTGNDPFALAREMSRLEREHFHGPPGQITTIEAILTLVRGCADDALLGRGLGLLSRAQIALGRHQVALRAADEGTAAFGRLDTADTHRWAGAYAETIRAGGTALLKLGRIGEALPRLEEAARIAQEGVDTLALRRGDGALGAVLGALVRSLVTLGIALCALRETDTAIAVYYRALAVAEAYPEAYVHFPDDVTLARSNLTDALHDRALRRRAAGSAGLAAHDIAAARDQLDAQARCVADSRIDACGAQPSARGRLTAYGRSSYFAALGQHLLITAKPAEARAMFELELSEIREQGFVDDWGYADAEAGLAKAELALGAPREALEHGARALNALDRHDESNTRASVLLVRAEAHRALGENAAAYETLQAHHKLRSGLEEVAALQYAGHLAAQLGLGRARADADSHRRIAAMLETLGRIGQEITANLDAGAVFRILQRHVGSLFAARVFSIWLLDETGERLSLSFGIEGDRTLAGEDIAFNDPNSLAARAVRERREILGDFSTLGAVPLAESRGTRTMRTALFAPLAIAGRVLGVVSIESERADAYSENDRSTFRTLATYAAIALDNAAAYTKLAKAVRTLQATQAELAIRTLEFERLSMTDPLTGVANRRHLHDRAAIEIAQVRRKAGRLAVTMFDIDRFKRVNDTFGHAAGDMVLQHVARVAKQWLRPGDFIARVGGEEFALLLPGADAREACAIAERIRASIAESGLVSGDRTVRVTSSFGVARFDTATDTFDSVLSRADAALYTAKQAGRNRVHHDKRLSVARTH